MKKSVLKKKRIANRSKMAIAATATMMAVPMMGIPVKSLAQMSATATAGAGVEIKNGTPFITIKHPAAIDKITGTYSIAGIDGTHTIYRNNGGEYFYIDQATGDMKFVSLAAFEKFEYIKSVGSMRKLPGKMKSGTITIQRMKFNDLYLKDKGMYGNVTLLGEDANGHDVIKNGSGQTFSIDPITGDFVPVSGK